MPPPTVSAATRDALARVVAALDFDALGAIYCDFGGTAFWAERRRPLVDLGLRWASELGRRLAPGGRSLYAGAGVAELAAMLFEQLDLGRTVTACSQRAAECAVLDRALAAAGLSLRVAVRDASEVAAEVEGAFDHLSLVSVLCDPETFPQVSEVAYGRMHVAQIDLATFTEEHRAISALVERVLARVQVPGLVTTTAEEVPWLLAWAERHGVRAAADDTMLETAVVGDPIGFLRLLPADSAPGLA
jgi:hypothetical protein